MPNVLLSLIMLRIWFLHNQSACPHSRSCERNELRSLHVDFFGNF